MFYSDSLLHFAYHCSNYNTIQDVFWQSLIDNFDVYVSMNLCGNCGMDDVSFVNCLLGAPMDVDICEYDGEL